jgi:hypothetical protein
MLLGYKSYKLRNFNHYLLISSNTVILSAYHCCFVCLSITTQLYQFTEHNLPVEIYLKCGIAVCECAITKNRCGFSYCFAVFSDYKILLEILTAVTIYWDLAVDIMAKAVFTLTWNLVSPFGSFTLLRHALCLWDVSLICVFLFVRPTYPSFIEQNVVMCEAVMKTEEWKLTIFGVVYLNYLGHWMW